MGDGFLTAGRTGAAFTYEGDLRILAGRAAALTFRDGYAATLDTDGVVKLWRPGAVLATAPAAVVPGRIHHLRVAAAGSTSRCTSTGPPTRRSTCGTAPTRPAASASTSSTASPSSRT